ncbi:MAG TPA: DUF4340 domain-containing protein [Anaerohalosphaeraceae bacterium]|nr:DUF4340 domain-containing protein [Anaerohalosphaeraceae bacterium]
MNDKKLAILGLVAVVSVAAAILVSRIGGVSQSSSLVIGPLIGGVDVDKINSIVVTGEKGTQKVTLVKSEKRFVVAEKENYPASTKKVNELVNQCLDIRTAELQSEDPAFHAELGLTDETAKTAVTFKDSAGQTIVGLLVSESKPESQEVFVRRADDNKAYLTLQSPWISSRPLDYLDTQLLQVDAKKILEVSVIDPNQVGYTLRSDNGGDVVTLGEMPAGKQFKGTTYRSVFSTLSSLNFEDVSPKDKVEGLTLDRRYICKLDDSTVYTLDLGKKEEKWYLKLKVEFTDKSEVVKEKGVESEEELKKKEAKLLARDAAEALIKKTGNWLYVIPQFKAAELTKSLNELIEDVPVKPKEPADPNKPVEAQAQPPQV